MPLWSSAFVTAGMKRKRGGEEEGRVWVGKEGGEEGDGPWIGVWEFRGDVGESKAVRERRATREAHGATHSQRSFDHILSRQGCVSR